MKAPQYLMLMGCQLHVLTVLHPQKQPLASTGQEAGRVPELIWTVWRQADFSLAWNGTPILQPKPVIFMNVMELVVCLLL
jgi:hypothetical protein